MAVVDVESAVTQVTMTGMRVVEPRVPAIEKVATAGGPISWMESVDRIPAAEKASLFSKAFAAAEGLST